MGKTHFYRTQGSGGLRIMRTRGFLDPVGP
jgi:hypothetical protein